MPLRLWMSGSTFLYMYMSLIIIYTLLCLIVQPICTELVHDTTKHHNFHQSSWVRNSPTVGPSSLRQKSILPLFLIMKLLNGLVLDKTRNMVLDVSVKQCAQTESFKVTGSRLKFMKINRNVSIMKTIPMMWTILADENAKKPTNYYRVISDEYESKTRKTNQADYCCKY